MVFDQVYRIGNIHLVAISSAPSVQHWKWRLDFFLKDQSSWYTPIQSRLCRPWHPWARPNQRLPITVQFQRVPSNNNETTGNELYWWRKTKRWKKETLCYLFYLFYSFHRFAVVLLVRFLLRSRGHWTSQLCLPHRIVWKNHSILLDQARIVPLKCIKCRD